MDSSQIIVHYLQQVILASQSEARKQLLEDLGCTVYVQKTDCDENHGSSVGPQVVQDLAERKLQTYLLRCTLPHLPVLAADTLISCDGLLIGKPLQVSEAREQLYRFRGRKHTVWSGFALYLPQGSRIILGSDAADVTFRYFDERELDAYLDSEQWQGAAGSYRIQGAASAFISQISGDYATVVGLPIQKISAILSSLDSL
jgi:septum formation protein